MVAAIANGGQLVTPRLVQQVGDTSAVRPAPRGLQLSEGTRDAIHLGLCDAVNEWGTAWRARLASVEVCGKTGSAQVVARPTKEQEEVPERLRAHAWFAGYAPGSDPRIALAVLVEHGGSGGAAAAPVAGEIIAQYLGLPAERAPSDVVPAEAD
jgi:penicillin-binding protein 2